MRTLNNSYSCRHHLEFLTKCIKDHLTPRGLRLHLKVNVIGTDQGELNQNIDTVLKTAEADILTLIADHYRTHGDTYHREANTLKQRMESLAAKLPEQERLQHAQEVDFTECRAQIRTREQETTRLKKHSALHHERITHPDATRMEPPVKRPRTTTQPDTPMETEEPTTLNPEPTLQLRSRSVPKHKGKAGPSRGFSEQNEATQNNSQPKPQPPRGTNRSHTKGRTTGHQTLSEKPISGRNQRFKRKLKDSQYYKLIRDRNAVHTQ